MGEDRPARGEMSFVIRLWLEPREVAAPSHWRWHIQHVQTGDHAYFNRWEDMVGYIERKSGQPFVG